MLDNLYKPQTEEEVVNEENQDIDPELTQMLQEAYEAGIQDGYQAAFAEDETALDEGVKEALQKASKKIKLFAQKHPKITGHLAGLGGNAVANSLYSKLTGRTVNDDIYGNSGIRGYNRAIVGISGDILGRKLHSKLIKK